MQHPAWGLIAIGVLLVGMGVIWLIAPSQPWLGKLPGDIAIEGKSFRFYFPIVTCFVLSLVITGILWLLRFFSR